MNLTTPFTDIQLILLWVIAKLQHQIQQKIIGVQITALKLNRVLSTGGGLRHE